MNGICTTPRRSAPTDEEFVNAVIEAHEHIRAGLQALLRGGVRAQTARGSEDARIIRTYCHAYGVDATAVTWPNQPGWLPV